MPFVSRKDIAPEVRARHEARHKRQLREALLTPGLSAAQREHLKTQIDSVGKAKVYKPESHPKPGAFMASIPRLDTIQRMKKAELEELAERFNLSTDGTKPELLSRIITFLT